jgi:hypothetical protein
VAVLAVIFSLFWLVLAKISWDYIKGIKDVKYSKLII